MYVVYVRRGGWKKNQSKVFCWEAICSLSVLLECYRLSKVPLINLCTFVYMIVRCAWTICSFSGMATSTKLPLCGNLSSTKHTAEISFQNRFIQHYVACIFHIMYVILCTHIKLYILSSYMYILYTYDSPVCVYLHVMHVKTESYRLPVVAVSLTWNQRFSVQRLMTGRQPVDVSIIKMF